MIILFYILFYSWTFIFFSSFFFVRLCSFKFTSKISKFWTKSIIKLIESFLGIRCKIKGIENLTNKPVIVVSNHQSAWETFYFFILFKDPTYVLKKELKRIPIMNEFFKKLGFIFVDRKLGSNSLRVILKKINKKEISSKRTIIIFPEGTRVNDEEKSKINPGFFFLYKHLDMPILPVVHNSGKYWNNQKFKKTSGVIDLKIFPSIAPGKTNMEILKLINSIFQETKKV